MINNKLSMYFTEPHGCSLHTFTSIIMLGIIALVLAIIIYFLRKHFSKKIFIIVEVLLLSIFILYSYDYDGGCGSYFEEDSDNYEVIFLPREITPYIFR